MKPRMVQVQRTEMGVQVRLDARVKKGCGQRKNRRDRTGRQMHRQLTTALSQTPGIEVHYTHRYDDGVIAYAGGWLKGRER